MSENRDYTKYSFRITFLVVAIMLGVSLIPPFSVGGVNFKRANILSDIIVFNDDAGGRTGELTDLDRQFLEEAEERGYLEPEEQRADTATSAPALEQEWQIAGSDANGEGGNNMPADLGALLSDGNNTFRFTDYTPEGRPSVAGFARMMEEASKTRVVRIAFMGDSYIEGDIITADVREQLQQLYGGQGVGFVPFGNPLAISRPTVTHTFTGWENHNLIYKKNAPEEFHDKFFVSGIISVPGAEGATSHYKGTRFRKHINQWSRAKLIFINNGGSVVDVAVNDSIRRRFTPDASEQVQQINLSGSGMRSLDVSVAQPEGFIGYGVVLDGGRGVAVDNYAIRSNSGIALFGTDKQINTQIGRMLGYDLIVLQWGLNAMSPEVTDYTSYASSLKRVINYVKSCFPQSAVIVMGVGDRATQRDGEFVTMEAVAAMRKAQKKAAEESGVAFWDTFEAMGGEGSIGDFVEKQWAAKDYMHLSYGGGRYIATRFVQALLDARNGGGHDNGFAGVAAAPAPGEELDLSTATPMTSAGDSARTVSRDSAGVVSRDSTRAVSRDSAGVSRDSAGAVIRNEAGISRDSAGVSRDSAGTVIRNETGTFRDSTGAISRDSVGAGD